MPFKISISGSDLIKIRNSLIQELQWLVLFSQCHIPPQPPKHSPATATHRRAHQQADQRPQAGVQISVKGPNARYFSRYFLSLSISSFRQTLNWVAKEGFSWIKKFRLEPGSSI
jgi:hypothetical protein